MVRRTLWIGFVAAVASACGQVSFRVSGRPCDGGQCAAGYECRPDTDTCVPRLERGCGGGAVCWSEIASGDSCEVDDAFLPCGPESDCSDGCRTCTGGVWSPCGFYDCVLGTLEHCAACGDDCTDSVLFADAFCNQFGAQCDYTACEAPARDADGDRTNGCECIPVGVEVCNGRDDDCNGTIDDLSAADVQSECDATYPDTHVLSWACATECIVGACDAGWLDVDGLPENGCEIDCLPTNGGVETCDGLDNDCNTFTDAADIALDEVAEVDADCGAQYPLASWVTSWECTGGACAILACEAGHHHNDTDVANGCEYACTITGAEACDGDDDDCNGTPDDMTPAAIQAECDALYPNVDVDTWGCSSGCEIVLCVDGFNDLDGIVSTGCESDCFLTNSGVETCDGIDNDCNDIDDDVADIATDCSAQNPLAADVQTWTCTAGACDIIACVTGTSDEDTLVSNGCEAVCVATGAELCDDTDNDCNGDIDDIAQVALNSECAVRYAAATDVDNWSCVTGECVASDCATDFYDIDGGPANGCEYGCTPSGPEICDNLDNDCDSLIDTADTSLDQQTEVNADCVAQHAPGTDVTQWSCTAGACGIVACRTGTYHYDTDLANGCEYACTIGGPEVCDDVDNDCDGDTDTADTDLDTPAELNADCVSQHAPGTDVTAWSCIAGACGIVSCATDTYHYDTDLANGCEYACTPSGAEVCDDSDNDCNGTVDDSADLGAGVCRCEDGLLAPAASEVCWDGVDDDCNDAIDDLCGCAPFHTFTIDNETVTCSAGDTAVAIAHLNVSTDCDNTLTSLILDRHAASNALDGDVDNFQLYEDVDNSGDFTSGTDLLLASDPTMSGGQIVFTGFALDVVSGVPRQLVVVADAVNDSYFAVEIAAPTSFTLADSGQGRALGSGAAPLVGGAHSLAAPLCAATDLGPGSQGAVSLLRVTGPGTAAWAAGAGAEGSWTAGTLETTVAADCDLDTSGDETVNVADAGQASLFLHIDTGVPLALPICGLSMRVYASSWRTSNGGRCDRQLLADHAALWLYPYTGAASVAPAEGVQVATTTVQNGADTPACLAEPSARTPHTDYLDIDITSLYGAASATGTLQVRLIAEADGDIDVSGATTINSIAEVYVRIEP